MARPRKPTHLHVINGTSESHPERMRERKDEPVDERALGNPPAKWKAAQKNAWKEIAALAPWLRKADRIAVEVAAELLCVLRENGPMRMPTPLLARFETMLGRLGLTPADRSKVKEERSKGSGGRFSGIGKPPTAT